MSGKTFKTVSQKSKMTMDMTCHNLAPPVLKLCVHLFSSSSVFSVPVY